MYKITGTVVPGTVLPDGSTVVPSGNVTVVPSGNLTGHSQTVRVLVVPSGNVTAHRTQVSSTYSWDDVTDSHMGLSGGSNRVPGSSVGHTCHARMITGKPAGKPAGTTQPTSRSKCVIGDGGWIPDRRSCPVPGIHTDAVAIINNEARNDEF